MFIFSNAFTQPTISDFTPKSGPIGTLVTIEGTNFDPLATNNIVYFGPVRGIISSSSPTTLVVAVPIGTMYTSITVTTNYLTAYSSKPFVVTFTGGGSFAAKQDFATGLVPRMFVVGDLDGDGKVDLAVANKSENNISILINTSTSGVISYAPKIDYPASSSSFISIGDIDGDGKLDIVITNTNVTPNMISIFRNISTPGTIAFTEYDIPTLLFPGKVTIGDIDGDGKPDLLLAYPTIGLKIGYFRNTSTPGLISFDSELDIVTKGVANAISIGDIDGDGKPDLVVTDITSNIFSVFRNTSTIGSISFDPRLDFTTGNSPLTAAIGDLDGDGKADVALTWGYPAFVSIFRNTSIPGSISFSGSQDYPMIDLANDIQISDLDGDGKPEVVPIVENSTPSYISELNNTSTPGNISFAPVVNYLTGLNPFSGAVVDIDGDGMPDLLSANATSGTISILKNQSSVPLPLSLLSFKGFVKENEVELIWQTTDELNTSSFEIERSIDNNTFSVIGSVKASNNPNGMTYEYPDANTPGGILYYRLKMTDINGSFSYSPVISLKLNEDQDVYYIFPNPTNSYIEMKHPVSSDQAYLKIIDITGRIVCSIKDVKGSSQTSIIVANLSHGTYEILWIDNNKTIIKSFIVN